MYTTKQQRVLCYLVWCGIAAACQHRTAAFIYNGNLYDMRICLQNTIVSITFVCFCFIEHFQYVGISFSFPRLQSTILCACRFVFFLVRVKCWPLITVCKIYMQRLQDNKRNKSYDIAQKNANESQVPK